MAQNSSFPMPNFVRPANQATNAFKETREIILIDADDWEGQAAAVQKEVRKIEGKLVGKFTDGAGAETGRTVTFDFVATRTDPIDSNDIDYDVTFNETDSQNGQPKTEIELYQYHKMIEEAARLEDYYESKLQLAIEHGGTIQDNVDNSLAGINASGLDWSNVVLVGVDLSNANLVGTNLSNATLTGATLTGATYDAATQWPAGFDPVAAGAVLV